MTGEQPIGAETMPVHDWSKVEAGIFHHFHVSWVLEIARALNSGILPAEYYALAEQHAVGFEADVLTLERIEPRPDPVRPASHPPSSAAGGTATATAPAALLTAPPDVQIIDQTDMDYYRRRQSSVVVRHVSGDRMVAVVEIVSPGNKAGRHAIQSFLEKACDLLEKRIHLLIVDLHGPTARDPNGVHGLIWETISGHPYEAPNDKPPTLVAYESALTVKAYVEPLAVGDDLKDMPLFLEPGAYVLVPLQRTYRSAFEALPRRWRDVLEPPG